MKNKCCKCGDDADFEVNGKNFCTKHILECLVDEEVDTLQELVDKEKTKPTEEEIIKEWQALNYKIEFQSDKYLVLRNRDLGVEFYIEKLNKKYGKYDVATLIYENITFEEHQLLTKTFKWLRW